MHWSQLFQFQASHQNAGQIFWVAIRGFSGCLLESLTAHNTSGVVNEQRLVVGRLAKDPAIAPSLSCQAPDAPPLKTGHRTNGPPTLGQMEPIWSVARWVFFFFAGKDLLRYTIFPRLPLLCRVLNGLCKRRGSSKWWRGVTEIWPGAGADLAQRWHTVRSDVLWLIWST